VGSAEVVISVTAPAIVLYDRDPLRGLMLDDALPSGIALNTKQFTIQAVPYYFASQSITNGSASYAWTLNGDDTTGPNAARGGLTLEQSGTGSGSAVIGVTLQNTDNNLLVQAAQTALQVVFGQSTSSGTSLFGL